MRSSQTLAVLAVLTLAAPSGLAQEMIVTYPEVKVYSGPSTKFYPTSTLRAGDKVEVVQTTDSQRGWLAIKPPPGSFSWVSQRFVHVSPNGRTGTVITDDVPILPGSSLSNEPPSVEKLKLKRGYIVVIVDKALYAGAEMWLPIAPVTGEVRYIEAYAVKTPNVATVAPAAPPPASPAFQQPGRPDNVAAAPPPTGNWQPANQPRTPGQTTALYKQEPAQTSARTAPPPPANLAQYSPYGILRKTAFQINGQAMYVLENQQGQPLTYVAAPPGFSLKPYVGRMISVYGTTSWSGEYLRSYYVTATHVAIP